MPEIVLVQTKTNAMEGFIGTIAVGGRGNNIERIQDPNTNLGLYILRAD